MVCNVEFVTHNCDNLLIMYSPLLFPILTSTETQCFLDDLHMWDTHLANGRKFTVADRCQAFQLSHLAMLLSFINIYSMLCKNKVRLALLPQKTHHAFSNLGFLCKHMFRNFLAIECRIMTNGLFSMQLVCTLQGNLADSFRSVAMSH